LLCNQQIAAIICSFADHIHFQSTCRQYNIAVEIKIKNQVPVKHITHPNVHQYFAIAVVLELLSMHGLHLNQWA